MAGHGPIGNHHIFLSVFTRQGFNTPATSQQATNCGRAREIHQLRLALVTRMKGECPIAVHHIQAPIRASIDMSSPFEKRAQTELQHQNSRYTTIDTLYGYSHCKHVDLWLCRTLVDIGYIGAPLP